MVKVTSWIKGNPPDNISPQSWWVWDGENIFLAIWRNDMDSWELAEPSFHEFKPEEITHYQVLSRPDKPFYLKASSE